MNTQHKSDTNGYVHHCRKGRRGKKEGREEKFRGGKGGRREERRGGRGQGKRRRLRREERREEREGKGYTRKEIVTGRAVI